MTRQGRIGAAGGSPDWTYYSPPPTVRPCFWAAAPVQRHRGREKTTARVVRQADGEPGGRAVRRGGWKGSGVAPTRATPVLGAESTVLPHLARGRAMAAGGRFGSRQHDCAGLGQGLQKDEEICVCERGRYGVVRREASDGPHPRAASAMRATPSGGEVGEGAHGDGRQRSLRLTPARLRRPRPGSAERRGDLRVRARALRCNAP